MTAREAVEGARVEHLSTGQRGTIANGRVMIARSAGNAPFVSVIWATKFGPSRGREFLSRLQLIGEE